jgi:hypothetical protein
MIRWRMPRALFCFFFVLLICIAAVGGSRVAVCITGHVRSFEKAHVHEAFATNVIEALRSTTVNVDVFMLLRVGTTPIKEQKNYHDAFPPSNMTNVRAAIDLIKPRFLQVVQDTSERGKSNYGGMNDNCTIQNAFMRRNLDRILQQMASWRECSDTMKSIEEENKGIKYDYLMRVRPDLLWYKPHLSFEKATTSKGRQGPPLIGSKNMNKDMYFFVPRPAINAVFVDIMQPYKQCKGNFPWTNTETWTAGHMSKVARDLGVEYREVVTPFIVVRASSKSESVRRKCAEYPGGVNKCLRLAYPDEYLQRSKRGIFSFK